MIPQKSTSALTSLNSNQDVPAEVCSEVTEGGVSWRGGRMTTSRMKACAYEI
jgi:hypothetical protein